MKKIVPFKKEIIFKSNLSEITSISLEHTLHYEGEHLITGEFVISGDYRMNDNSENTENFSFDIPFDINMDEKYILDKAVVDINDFYYEIINNKVLSVNIEVSIDKLEEQPLTTFEELIDEPVVEHQFEERSEESLEKMPKVEQEEVIKKEIEEVSEERCVEKEEDDTKDNRDIEPVKSLFDSVTSEEEYAIYRVCIVREGDSLESIMMKYNISKEQMELYNDLKEIKIGDKLIIPSVKS